MNDWSAEVTGTYGLQVENLRKGRGAWILETDGGLKLLKEYKGSVKRLEFEEQVLAAVNGQSGLKVDQYQRNLEGGLLSPQLMSDATRLHPVIVVLSVMLGGMAGGVGGILLSVPLVLCVRAVLRVVGAYRADRWPA